MADRVVCYYHELFWAIRGEKGLAARWEQISTPIMFVLLLISQVAGE
jgi:hypothetical protein